MIARILAVLAAIIIFSASVTSRAGEVTGVYGDTLRVRISGLESIEAEPEFALKNSKGEFAVFKKFEETGETGNIEETEKTAETGNIEETEETGEAGDIEETEKTEENGNIKETEETEESENIKETEETEESGNIKETEETEESGNIKETEETGETGNIEETEETEGTPVFIVGDWVFEKTEETVLKISGTDLFEITKLEPGNYTLIPLSTNFTAESSEIILVGAWEYPFLISGGDISDYLSEPATGDDAAVVVLYTENKLALPVTGGRGSGWYYIVGGAIVVVSMAVLAARFKGRKK